MSFVNVPWDYVRYYLGEIFAARDACAQRAGTMSDYWMRRHGYLPAPLSLRRRLVGLVLGRWEAPRRG